MAATELQRAHLHPLTFALDPLEERSSLELALVPFHLDNDEPGFDAVVDKARHLWLDRRHRRVEASQARPPPRPPPPPPPAAAPSRRTIPEVFIPLVQALRTVSLKQSTPSCSGVGNELLKIAPSIYKTGRYPNFKTLRLDAQKAGIVEFIKGKETGGGGDFMRLTSKFQDVPLLPPTPSAPIAPPPPSMHTADDFHLMPLDFDPSLDDLAALPTHHVLLLQFRDDIQVLPHETIERVFWRRRALALERGEELLSAATSAPRFVPRASSPLAAGHAAHSHGRSSTVTSRAPPPPLPALDEPLPPAVSDPLHPLEILYLPPDTVPTIPHLLALFPPHLLPLASILHPPSATPIASTSTAPSSTVVARSAYVAFFSHVLATEAHAHLNGLRVPSSIGGGGAWSLWAGALPSGVKAGWQWGDVRPEERDALWREVCEQWARDERRASEAGEADEAVKRRREEEAKVDARGGSPKRQKVEHIVKVVAPSDPVPPVLLDSLFPATLTWSRSPKGLNVLDMADDAFVWRFHAVAWAENTPSRGFELLFSSAEDRDMLVRWVDHDAPKRYWKANGVVVHISPSTEAARARWRFSDLSPSFRRHHGIVLDPAAIASARTQVVGELGEGPDPPPGAPSYWRAGWFEFEYVMHGHKPPLRPPVIRRSDTSSLASRLGGTVDDKVLSAGTASRRPSRGDDALAPSSVPHAPDSSPAPVHATALGSTSSSIRPAVDLAPGDADADFYLEPFSSYSPSIDPDPFASIASPASPSALAVDDPFDTPLSSLGDDDHDPAFSTSLFAAARSFYLSPSSDDVVVKGPRVDAIALCDFADELDCAMDLAAQHFGTAVERDDQDDQDDQDEQNEQEDVKMRDGEAHEQLEQVAVEPGRAPDQEIEMVVDVDNAVAETEGRVPAAPAAAAAEYAGDMAQQDRVTPVAFSSASRSPVGPEPAMTVLEPTHTLVPEPPVEVLRDAPVGQQVLQSDAAVAPTRSVAADLPVGDTFSPSRSASQVQRAVEDLPSRATSSSSMQAISREESERSTSPHPPQPPVVAPGAPVVESVDAVDASTSAPSLDQANDMGASSSRAVVVAPEASHRAPLAARFSSTSPRADPPLACRLSPLPLPWTPPLAARLGLRPSSSTPPPADRSPSSSSTSAPSLAAPSLSLAERLSPRAPGRVLRTSPRREAAVQAAVQGELG